MGFFGKKPVKRRIVASLNDIPSLRPDETMTITTFLKEGDEIVSNYDPEKDSTETLHNLVNAHLRLGQVPPPNPPVARPNPPAPPPNPPQPPPNPPQPQYTKIINPSHQDLLVAARRFNDVAVNNNFEYAIIGGLAAVLYGGIRQTKSLDILIKPGGLPVRQRIRFLFDNFPDVFETTTPDLWGPGHRIVIIAGTTGVPINFFDCQNNNIDFPDLVLHATYNYPLPHAPNMPAIALPVLRPRYLLRQRLRHFGRDQAQLNDFSDIFAFLHAMPIHHEFFMPPEVPQLFPGIGDVLLFAAQLHFAPDAAPWQAVGVNNPWQNYWGVQIRPPVVNGIYRSNQLLL